MRTNSKSLLSQRTLIGRKLKPWNALRSDLAPGSGWIKAMRGALGMSSRQLAARLGVTQSTITRLEKREAEGKVTLEILRKVARAMNAQLIYAIVPAIRYADLEELINDQAKEVAQSLVRRNEHSMRLEKQGIDDRALTREIDKLARELTNSAGSRIWRPTELNPATRKK